MRKKMNVFSLSSLMKGLPFLIGMVLGIKGWGTDFTPLEYCQQYIEHQNLNECTSYCTENKDFNNRLDLIKGCQYGQYLFLKRGTNASHACDRQFKVQLEMARACRIGANEENARASRINKPTSIAIDRETGNRNNR